MDAIINVCITKHTSHVRLSLDEDLFAELWYGLYLEITPKDVKKKISLTQLKNLGEMYKQQLEHLSQLKISCYVRAIYVEPYDLSICHDASDWVPKRDRMYYKSAVF